MTQIKNSESANPYKAGWGLWPPCLAGRQHEVKAIVNALGAIKDGAGRMDHSPAPALVLVGPRGVGKTVLLERALVEAEKHGIQTAEISRELLSEPQKHLARHVFSKGIFRKIIGIFKSVTVGIVDFFVSAELRDGKGYFGEAMSAFLARKPLLIVLDEAHTCDSEALKVLFGAAQSCMKSRMPLALILAGTPGLRPLLQRCDAAYVERSKILRINNLSDDEAREALEIPAKETGRPMAPDAIQLLLDWSDNYPFFIQMVGTYAWDASDERSGKEISVEDAKKALAEAGRDRNEFYEDRYEELKRRHLAEHAIQVVIIMRKIESRADSDELERRLMEMNEGMDRDKAMEVTKDLQEVGFIWRSSEGIEPAILSMFDYIVRKHKVSVAS